jgi:hypothetical protein
MSKNRLITNYPINSYIERLNKMKNKQLLWITTTAVLLALIVVAQILPFPSSIPLLRQLFTGSLINLILITAAGSIGLKSGATLAVLSPVLAFLLGQLPAPLLIPIVATGNFIVVLVTWWFFKEAQKKESKSGMLILVLSGVLLGAIFKCAFLWIATAKIITPILVSKSTKQVLINALNLSMSWPQAIAAIVGGILALLILPSIKRYIKNAFI